MSDSEEEVRPTFIQIDHDLYEEINLFDFSKREGKIMYAVVRKTIGWQKDFDYISSSQIAEMTGLHSTSIRKSIRELIDRNIILKSGRKIGINKDRDGWIINQKGTKHSEKKKKLPGTKRSTQTEQNVPPLEQNVPEKRNKTFHTKETNKPIQKKSLDKRDEEQAEMSFEEEKTTKKPVKRKSKKYTDGPPDFVDPENWDAFMEIREIKKAPQTERAIKMLIKKLRGFHDKGLNADEILCNSTMAGWTSVFEPKAPSKPKNDTGWLGQTYEEFSRSSNDNVHPFTGGITIPGKVIQ